MQLDTASGDTVDTVDTASVDVDTVDVDTAGVDTNDTADTDAQEDDDRNSILNVQDFNWLSQTQSPNFSAIKSADAEMIQASLCEILAASHHANGNGFGYGKDGLLEVVNTTISKIFF